jgi:hypothetical protein
MEFKIGDRVKVIAQSCERSGLSGTVAVVDDDPDNWMPYMVEFADWGHRQFAFAADELALPADPAQEFANVPWYSSRGPWPETSQTPAEEYVHPTKGRKEP